MAASWAAPAMTISDDAHAAKRSRPESAMTTPSTKPNGMPGTARGMMSRKPRKNAVRSKEKPFTERRLGVVTTNPSGFRRGDASATMRP